LYDISKDIGETKNVVAQYPEKAALAERYLKEAHRPDPNWKVPQPRKKK
jgi:hypothetical protein